MTEIEQLRKEVNELRERLVQIEITIGPLRPLGIPQPMFIQQPPGNPFQPPYVVTCTSGTIASQPVPAWYK